MGFIMVVGKKSSEGEIFMIQEKDRDFLLLVSLRRQKVMWWGLQAEGLVSSGIMNRSPPAIGAGENPVCGCR